MINGLSTNSLAGGDTRLDYILTTIKNEKQVTFNTNYQKVVHSWKRCIKDYKLNPDGRAESIVLDAHELFIRCEKLESFLSIAQEEVDNLYEQVSESGSAIMVVDPDGYVLGYRGDREFTEIGHANGLRLGSNWSEPTQGTNAMGTCIAERKPLLIHHTDHFFARNISLTCAAAPIFDAHGELLGVLDASSSSNLAQQHTAVLVNMAAQTIENRVFLDQFRNFYIIRFHSRLEFINTLGEGIIAFNGEGKLVALNRCARQQFDFKNSLKSATRCVNELFEARTDELLAFAERQSIYPTPIRCAQNGRRFYALAQPPVTHIKSKAFCFTGHQTNNEGTRSSSNVQIPLINKLELGDDYTRSCIEQAKKITNSGVDLPIIIRGETGTGKGLFAKTLHRYSERRDKPFISVNCASIPESLMESELFGYSAGTFTGANRSGNMGKVRAADSGTLFLDEIGDMPLHLQTALLQILEDREVVPLGSSTPIPVDLRIISATHQDLQSLVHKKLFREDLLYRLQGLTIKLPALQQRKDLCALAEKFLNEDSSEKMSLSAKAREIINNFAWPGNIRQLRNIMRTTRVFAQTSCIHPSELPQEICHSWAVTLDTQSKDATSGNKPGQQCTLSLSPLEQAEFEAIEDALKKYSWSVTKVAKNLNLSRTTLYRKIKKYNIQSPKL